MTTPKTERELAQIRAQTRPRRPRTAAQMLP